MSPTYEESQLLLKIAGSLHTVKHEMHRATETFLQKAGENESVTLYVQQLCNYLAYLDKLCGELKALATQNNPEEKRWAFKLFIRGFFISVFILLMQTRTYIVF